MSEMEDVMVIKAVWEGLGVGVVDWVWCECDWEIGDWDRVMGGEGEEVAVRCDAVEVGVSDVDGVFPEGEGVWVP